MPISAVTDARTVVPTWQCYADPRNEATIGI